VKRKNTKNNAIDCIIVLSLFVFNTIKAGLNQVTGGVMLAAGGNRACVGI
jgi:hypothetical protein